MVILREEGGPAHGMTGAGGACGLLRQARRLGSPIGDVKVRVSVRGAADHPERAGGGRGFASCGGVGHRSLPYAGTNRIRFNGCISAAAPLAAAPRANARS